MKCRIPQIQDRKDYAANLDFRIWGVGKRGNENGINKALRPMTTPITIIITRAGRHYWKMYAYLAFNETLSPGEINTK